MNEQNKIKLRAALEYGDEKGTQAFLRHYDTYRKYSGLILALVTVALLVSERNLEAFVLLALVHVHVLLNQIWWKLKTIEYHYDRILGDLSGEAKDSEDEVE